jgi:predicted transcriptional regulator
MQISPAESEVMEVLWQHHPQSAEDIVTALQRTHPWQPSTIKTLLSRLLGKGAIKRTKQERLYLYQPCLQREQYLLAESSGVIDRLFEGRVAPLVAHLSEHRKLSQKDIDELQRIIDEMRHGR